MAGETYQFSEAEMQMYSSNVELLLQDLGKSLAMKASQGNYRGSKGARAVNQFGQAPKPHRNLPRYSDTPIDSVPQAQVWVFPQTLEHFVLIDWPDQDKIGIDLESPLTQTGEATMRRGHDEVMIDALFATRKIGENGGTDDPFPSAQEIAVTEGAASATGLNVKKLKLAKKKLKQSHVDLDVEQAWIAITAQQEEDLLNDIEIINRDYANQAGRPILDAKGNIVAYQGFNFLHKEGLLTDASDYRRCPVWVESGMHWGVWRDIETIPSRRGDKRNAEQLHMRTMVGATRTQNEKVVEILCAEP